MPRIRTFIAAELSPSVKSRASALIESFRGAAAEINWVRPQHMHLTLKFLGDVPDTETPDVCKVVARVAAQVEPFEVHCRGVGAFPSIEHPKTLWIGIADGADQLVQLQQAIDEALTDELGYGRELRAFHPHLTIGRVKQLLPQGREDLVHLLKKHADYDAELAIIDEVVTFASFLSRQGPTHDALDRAELRG